MRHWSEEKENFIKIKKALSEGTIDGEIISTFPVTLETANAFFVLAKEFQPITVEEYKSEIRWIIVTFGRMSKGLAPMINLFNEIAVTLENLDEKESIESVRDIILKTIDQFINRFKSSLEITTSNCAKQFKDREKVFVYSCSKTVNTAIIKARDMGKKIEVVVTESRPWCEGLNTVKTLCRNNIQVTLGIDAALNPLLNGCTLVLVGAESISYKGDALCKIGTYPLAMIARERKIPVKIVADLSKLDITSLYLDSNWPIYGPEGPKSDLLKYNEIYNVKVRNIMSEVVPSKFISEIITEKGVIYLSEDLIHIAKSIRFSKSFLETILN